MPISSVTDQDTPNSGRDKWNADVTDLDTRINTNAASINSINRTRLPFFLPGIADLIESGAAIVRAGVLEEIRVVCKRAPTGAAMIVSVRKNGGEVASISVAAGATTATTTGLSVPCANGDAVSVAVVQVGSTVQGEDVSVAVDINHAITPATTQISTFSTSASTDQWIMSFLNNNASTGAPGTYPPSGNITRDTTSQTLVVGKEFYAGTAQGSSGQGYFVRNILLSFPTASLPDTATIVSARVRLGVFGSQVSDPNRALMFEQFNWTGSSNTDYSSTPTDGALLAEPMINVRSGTYWVLPMSTPLTWVSRTTTTLLRMHVSGGQPTNSNFIQFYSSENTSAFDAPQLLVEWF